MIEIELDKTELAVLRLLQIRIAIAQARVQETSESFSIFQQYVSAKYSEKGQVKFDLDKGMITLEEI